MLQFAELKLSGRDDNYLKHIRCEMTPTSTGGEQES